MATTAIGEVKDCSFVKIVGRVEPLETPLRGPVGGEECVVYRVVGKTERDRRIEEERRQDFLLRDDRGDEAIVRGHLATVDTQATSSTTDLTGPVMALLRRQDVPEWDWNEYGFVERFLKRGCRVAVAGRAHLDKQPDEGGPYRVPRRGQLVIGDGEEVVLISDHPAAWS